MAKKKTEFTISNNCTLVNDPYVAIQDRTVGKEEYEKFKKHIELEQKMESRRRWNRRRRK